VTVRADDVASLDLSKKGGGATRVDVLGDLSGLLADMVEVHHIRGEDSAAVPTRLALQFED
jgi:hypothetical protein